MIHEHVAGFLKSDTPMYKGSDGSIRNVTPGIRLEWEKHGEVFICTDAACQVHPRTLLLKIEGELFPIDIKLIPEDIERISRYYTTDMVSSRSVGNSVPAERASNIPGDPGPEESYGPTWNRLRAETAKLFEGASRKLKPSGL